MTSGEFVKLIARATGTDEATTASYFRVAREAGLITTGARGVNAPAMTWRDAARMLIALATVEKPSQAANAIEDFGKLQCLGEQRGQDRHLARFRLKDLPAAHPLEDGIAGVLQLFAQKVLPAGCEIKFRLTQLNAEIRLQGATYSYVDTELLQSNRIRVPKNESDEEFLSRLRAEHAAETWLDRAERYSTKIQVEKVIGPDVVLDVAKEFARVEA